VSAESRFDLARPGHGNAVDKPSDPSTRGVASLYSIESVTQHGKRDDRLAG